MSYQRCTTPGPLIEVVKTWSVSRRSYAQIASRATTRVTHDVPIQFISSTLALNPHGEMDGRINGCTWPIQFSRVSEDASRTPALLSNPRMRWSNETRYFFSLLVSLSFRIFRRSYILFFFSTFSTEHDCAPRAVTLGTRRPLHNLEIYFHLQGILQMYRTSRIDENKAKILGLGF